MLAREVTNTEELVACESLVKYYNGHTSNYIHMLEKRLVKIKEYLVIGENGLIRAITEKQV